MAQLPISVKKSLRLRHEETLRGIRMVHDPNETLRKQVNSSGFPLQIGIKNAVQESGKNQEWKVITEEYPWKNEVSGESGFIDLILEHNNKTQVMLVECKRVRDCEWIFLVPSVTSRKVLHVNSWTSFFPKFFDWMDHEIIPESFESKFCVVRGQDDKNPMLEREASKIIEATEAFATEQRLRGIPGPEDLRAYFSVIVTTANLKICRFDQKDIDIKIGEVSKCDFEDVSFVRFRKALTARNEDPPQKDIYKMFQEKERTVLVVNSDGLLDLLKEWEFYQNRKLPS